MKLLTKPLELALLPDAIILINSGSKIANPKLVNGKWTGSLSMAASRLGKEAVGKYKGIEQGMAANVLNLLYTPRTVIEDSYEHNFHVYYSSDKTASGLHKLGLFQTMDSQFFINANTIKSSVRFLGLIARPLILQNSPINFLIDNPWSDGSFHDQTAILSLYEELPENVWMYGVDEIKQPLTSFQAVMGFIPPDKMPVESNHGYSIDIHGLKTH